MRPSLRYDSQLAECQSLLGELVILKCINYTVPENETQRMDGQRGACEYDLCIRETETVPTIRLSIHSSVGFDMVILISVVSLARY